jgi:hypothetical protein
MVQHYKLFLGPDSILSFQTGQGTLLLRSRFVFSSRSLFIETMACVNERIKVMMLSNEYRLLLAAAIPPPGGLSLYCN